MEKEVFSHIIKLQKHELKGIIVAARNDAINKPIYPHSAKASISKFNPLLIININSSISKWLNLDLRIIKLGLYSFFINNL